MENSITFYFAWDISVCMQIIHVKNKDTQNNCYYFKFQKYLALLHTNGVSFCSWVCLLCSNIKDIHSVLEVTVYDEDRDRSADFLGRVAIPLLSVSFIHLVHSSVLLLLKGGKKNLSSMSVISQPRFVIRTLKIFNILNARPC
jgi:hypothetical protein